LLGSRGAGTDQDDLDENYFENSHGHRSGFGKAICSIMLKKSSCTFTQIKKPHPLVRPLS